MLRLRIPFPLAASQPQPGCAETVRGAGGCRGLVSRVSCLGSVHVSRLPSPVVRAASVSCVSRARFVFPASVFCPCLGSRRLQRRLARAVGYAHRIAVCRGRAARSRSDVRHSPFAFAPRAWGFPVPSDSSDPRRIYPGIWCLYVDVGVDVGSPDQYSYSYMRPVASGLDSGRRSWRRAAGLRVGLDAPPASERGSVRPWTDVRSAAASAFVFLVSSSLRSFCLPLLPRPSVLFLPFVGSLLTFFTAPYALPRPMAHGSHPTAYPLPSSRPRIPLPASYIPHSKIVSLASSVSFSVGPWPPTYAFAYSPSSPCRPISPVPPIFI